MTSPFRPTNPFADEPDTPKGPAPMYRPTNPFANEEQAARQETARVRSLVNGVQHSPEQAAEALTLSRRTGVPADVALRNLDPLRQMASVEEFDADTFVRENPATSRWLQAAPINPALARDDFESLTALERITGRGTVVDRFLQGMGNLGMPASQQTDFTQNVPSQRGTIAASFTTGNAAMEESVLYGQFRAEERRDPAVQARLAAARARQVELPEPTGLFEESLRSAVSGFLPSMLFVSGAALEGAAVGGASGAAMGVIGGPVSGVTAGLGASVGAKLAGYNAYRLLMTGELAKSLESARDANGQPIPDVIQDRVALAGGAGLALLGMYGFDKAVGILGAGSSRVMSRVVAMGVAKSLTTRSAARVGLEVARVYGASVAFETAQEVTEQAGLIAAESVAREIANAQGMEFSPVENVMAELGETAVQTALGALWFGGIGAVGAGAVGMARVQKAQEDADQLAEAFGVAEASKLRQRDPDAFESVVQEQVKAAGREFLSVDGERLQILLQEQSVPLEAFAAEMQMDVRELLTQMAQGSDVQLPTARILARLSGTDLMTPMGKILKWRPDGLAPVEAEELASVLETEGAAIAKELGAEVEIAKGSPEEKVAEAWVAQIAAASVGLPKSANFTPANIQAQADLFAKMYGMAARVEGKGQDAWTLFQARSPRFVAPAVAEPLYDALREAQKLEKSGKKPERLAELRQTIATLRQGVPESEFTRLEQAAFHGTPHSVDKFSLDKIGTGEGAQAYGWGLYYAENENVAEGYRKSAIPERITEINARMGELVRVMDSDAIGGQYRKFRSDVGRNAAAEYDALMDERSTLADGNLYQVDIPDEAVSRMLDWDKPLSEQAPEVIAALATLGFQPEADASQRLANARATGNEIDALVEEQTQSGEAIYRELSNKFRKSRFAVEKRDGADNQASLALLEAGIPGIKYLDAGSRGAQDGTRNLVVFDESLVTITHRNGAPVTAQERTDFLAQSSKDRPNAFILPNVSQRTIAVMQTANLSSVLHEMAHDFLFLYRDLASAPDATPEAQAFFADIRKALHIADGAAITEAHQETFARGFERYAMDGKAPSRGLARAFVRFAAFMTDIYRKAKDLLVPISPELRDVFDRMIATEEELAEVRGALGTTPMFTESEAELIGAEAVAAYQAKVDLRTAEEQGMLLKRILAERSDEYRKVKSEAQKGIFEDVSSEVAERPVYQAVRELLSKDAAKLDRGDLEAQFGDGIAQTLPRGITTSDGEMVPVDVVALRYGFRDGTALVAALQDAKANPERREVARIVADRMREAFPDPMESSVVLREEAMRAAHIGETDDVLLAELKFLGTLAGIVPRGNRAVTLEAVRKVARDTMAKERVRDIRPIVYANAEARAAKKSGEAMKKGDYATAEKYKRQQMVQHILYREAVKAVEFAEVVRKFARKLEGTASQERIGKAGAVYADAINEVLDRYEFRQLARPESERRDESAVRVEAWLMDLGDEAPQLPAHITAKAMARPYSMLSLAQLQDVYDTLKSISHTASLVGKERRAERAMLFVERKALLIAAAQKHWTATTRVLNLSPSWWDAKKKALGNAHGVLIKPEMFFRLMDGDQSNGMWQETFSQAADDARADFNRKMEEFTTRYKAAMDRITPERRKSFFSQLIQVDGLVGPGTANPRMSGDNVFRLLLNYGNESSVEAVNAATFNGERPFADANARKMFALLQPEEMRAAQDVWNAVSMFWTEMAELQREETGFTPLKVEARQITLKAADGSEVTLNGGYFPLDYDADLSSKAFVQQQQRVEEVKEGGLVPFVGRIRATTRQGQFIERQNANGRMVNLSPSVVANHMTAVLYDLTHRRLVYDVQKLLLDEEISGLVERTAGLGVYRYSLLPWSKRLANEGQPTRDEFEKVLMRARTGATVVGIGFNVMTKLMQGLGLGQVAALIGPKYMARGFAEVLKYRHGAYEAADAMAAAVAFRASSMDREIRDVAANLSAAGKFTDRTALYFSMITIADRQVSMVAFWGGYYQWLDAHPTDVEGSIRAGEQAVRLSQGANDAKDLAQAAAGGDALRLVTSFYSNGSTLYSLFWRAQRAVAEKRDAPSVVLATMVGAWILPAIAEPYLRARTPDDDDELSEKVAWWVWQISTYPLQAFPIAKDLAGAWEPGVPNNWRDYSPAFTRPFSAFGEGVYRAMSIAVSDDEMDKADVKVFVENLGYWQGLPTAAVWRFGDALQRWMEGYDVSPMDFIRTPRR